MSKKWCSRKRIVISPLKEIDLTKRAKCPFCEKTLNIVQKNEMYLRAHKVK